MRNARWIVWMSMLLSGCPTAFPGSVGNPCNHDGTCNPGLVCDAERVCRMPVVTIDAGRVDAGAIDAARADAGPVDAGPVDAGPADAAIAPACGPLPSSFACRPFDPSELRA